MSEFTDLTHLPITDDVTDSVGLNDPTNDNDASSDEGDTVGGDESDADRSEMGDEDDIGGEDIEGDDVGGDDEDGAYGAYDEEAGEPSTMEDDDDASVSSADSDGSDDSERPPPVRPAVSERSHAPAPSLSFVVVAVVPESFLTMTRGCSPADFFWEA